MSVEDFFRSKGLDPKTGQNPLHASGGAFRADPSPSTRLFVFYVMMGGNPSFVVLANSSPIIEHKSSTATSADAAFEALFARGLVLLGTGKPTVIHSINGLFGKPVINFVQVDQTALVQPGHSLLGSKVYSIVDGNGNSKGGKDASILGFGAAQYAEMRTALLPMLPSSTSPPMAAFARGGGDGGGTVASPHHVGAGKKSHPSPTCGHAQCTHLHTIRAGHGGIVIPYFEYPCKDGSKKPVMIMGFENRRSGNFWNLLCEKMEDKDKGCWIRTIVRALREEGKIFLSRHLEEGDIKLGKPIGRTPVFYVKLDRIMVTHDLSCGVLNAQVAADNASTLPHCFKEIQAIGLFERVGNNLFPLPGNLSGYPNTFSTVVNSWLSS